MKRKSPIRTTSHPSLSSSRSASVQGFPMSSRDGSPLRIMSASRPVPGKVEPHSQQSSLEKIDSDAVPPFRSASPSSRKVAMETPASLRSTTEPVRRINSFPMEYGAESISRRIPYRPGFQPKGVVRHRTDEFLERRAKHVDMMDLDEQRMERRLGKLMTIYSPEFEPVSYTHLTLPTICSV